MDVMKVREITSQMLSEIRAGSGPQFLEAITYRYRGHSMGDPERYRTPEEIKKWQENDPIGIYHNYLIEHQIANQEELDAETAAAEKEVEDGVAFAESSPEPAPEDLFTNIYVES